MCVWIPFKKVSYQSGCIAIILRCRRFRGGVVWTGSFLGGASAKLWYFERRMDRVAGDSYWDQQSNQGELDDFSPTTGTNLAYLGV
jgi:hypothetical protein